VGPTHQPLKTGPTCARLLPAAFPGWSAVAGRGSLPVGVRTIGLTGGIGTGKSTLAAWLQKAAVPVVDTDELARVLVEPGQPALAEIRAAFGSAVFDRDGCLRRDALADRVFSDAEARRVLEEILHPRIHAAWRARVTSWQAGGMPLAVVVIPLLFEKGLEKNLDRTVCVACRPSTQWERLRARGWNEGEIQRRLAAQMPLTEKMQRADRVIWSEGSIALLEAQARRILVAEGWPADG
jgi:dephospho-CoA kinase